MPTLVWIQTTLNNHGDLLLAGLVHCVQTLTVKALQLFMVINMFLKIVSCELRLKSAIWRRQPKALRLVWLCRPLLLRFHRLVELNL